MTPPIPVWLDCDPGHDDAFAMLLASALPEFKLVGVSTVYGNASLTKTTNNALSLLTAYGIKDIDVFPGADKPLIRPLEVAPSIHGESGLDGTDLLPTSRFAAQPLGRAIDAIAKAANEYPGQLALVATGTLTNIAILVKTYPEVLKKIRVLSIMGGGLKIGNWSEYAEFNIFCDALAAQTVFENPILAPKTVLAPLDFTHQATAGAEFRNKLRGSKSNLRQMLFEILTFFAETYEQVFGFSDGPPVHDPLSVLVLLQFCGVKDLGVEYTKYHIEVVQQGTKEGKLEVTPDENGISICERMDMNILFDNILQAIKIIDHHN